MDTLFAVSKLQEEAAMAPINLPQFDVGAVSAVPLCYFVVIAMRPTLLVEAFAAALCFEVKEGFS